MHNETENGDNDFFDSKRLVQFLKTFLLTCYTVTFVVGIVGNGLVIWVAGFKMKSVSAVWFLNLAIADFTGCAFLPFCLAKVALATLNGVAMCLICSFGLILSMCASVFFLVFISLDQCVLVKWPFWASTRRPLKLAHIVSWTTWVYSLCFSFLFVLRSITYQNLPGCFGELGKQFMYFHDPPNILRNLQFLLLLFLPFTMILTSYGLIFYKLGEPMKTRSSHQPYRIAIAVIVCSFVCRFPYYIWPFLDIQEGLINYLMYNIFHCLAYINSCINPIIYVLFYGNFKGNFIKSIPTRLERAFTYTTELQSCEDEGEDRARLQSNDGGSEQ